MKYPSNARYYWFGRFSLFEIRTLNYVSPCFLPMNKYEQTRTSGNLR
nr:MAG TPA: hypothetical protein [Caudoviricetes sp.]